MQRERTADEGPVTIIEASEGKTFAIPAPTPDVSVQEPRDAWRVHLAALARRAEVASESAWQRYENLSADDRRQPLFLREALRLSDRATAARDAVAPAEVVA